MHTYICMHIPHTMHASAQGIHACMLRIYTYTVAMYAAARGMRIHAVHIPAKSTYTHSYIHTYTLYISPQSQHTRIHIYTHTYIHTYSGHVCCGKGDARACHRSARSQHTRIHIYIHTHIHTVAMYAAARGMCVHAIDPLEVNIPAFIYTYTHTYIQWPCMLRQGACACMP